MVNDSAKPKIQKGRGAGSNPTGRFEANRIEVDDEGQAIRAEFNEGDEVLARTQFLKDATRTIVTENKSPDIGFRYSINAYRGCEHGCAYCYARPTHEYLGHSAGIDFESKIYVKENAAELLHERLMKPSWEGEPIFMSGITDCYQPAERKFELTRSCLRVLSRFNNPVGIITKNRLVTRDIDLLAPMARKNLCLVMISMTSLDPSLSTALEPRTSVPLARLQAVRELAAAGIYVGVNLAPMIPGLNDHEMPAILKAAKEAGAKFAGYTPVRLPLTVLPVFTEWLELHRPERKDKILSLIRSMRGGKLNEAEFGSRMTGEGPLAEHMSQMFNLYARREGLNQEDFNFSRDHFCRPGDQLSLL